MGVCPVRAVPCLALCKLDLLCSQFRLRTTVLRRQERTSLQLFSLARFKDIDVTGIKLWIWKVVLVAERRKATLLSTLAYEALVVPYSRDAVGIDRSPRD